MPSIIWLALILVIPSVAALALRYLFVRSANRPDVGLDPGQEVADEMASALIDVAEPMVDGAREKPPP